ncbi:MAG: glycerate kinase [Elusimicrobiota bacterium]|jgi:hydroxypyruvate reductase|nr:glycerate kinase [Elusimicrobiota bacterium]
MSKLYTDAQTIINKSIADNMPQSAVRKALGSHKFYGKVYLFAVGKAAWAMAEAANKYLGTRVSGGVVITKYAHSKGAIGDLEIIEAGHPISDENTILGTQKILDIAQYLGEKDEVVFLISGGGSALFEKPLKGITLSDIAAINRQLLACGADIVEINMIRKRLSAVKAGRFAEICYPARIFTIVLSDVLGDRLDSIASGPAAPDLTSAEEALAVIEKYDLKLKNSIREYILKETPKKLHNVKTVISGSVSGLCESAAKTAKSLGYEPLILCSDMKSEAREIGFLLSSIACQIDKADSLKRPCAVILGGETVVHLKGSGKGGRNQETALAAAAGIEGLKDILIFSAGSDGTDGPTDAAGGIVDGQTAQNLREKNIKIDDVLKNNDSYNALKAVNALLFTGPTGTNVNDIAVILAGRGA